MMNRYYGSSHPFSGRNPRGGERYDRSPYRRPMGRSTLPVLPGGGDGRLGNSGGGCGCSALHSPRPVTAKTVSCADHNGFCGSGRSEERAPRSETARTSCGCGGNNQSDCRKLLEQIRAVDFALCEVILYLDVYPHSCEALDTYHKLQAQRNTLCREYEAACGPLTALGNESHTVWNWIASPFPWEYGAE